MYRSDYVGPQPPKRLVDLITKRGGKNIFGEANYRLVHCEFRRTPSGGTWLDWPEEASVAERQEGRAIPVRRVVETRQILSYPNEKGKWILEKWCPPETYGTPAAWYLPVTSGGTVQYIPSRQMQIAALGPYPFKGEYENYGYAFPTAALTESIILTAIGRIEHAIDKMPSTPKGRILRKMFNALQAEELKQRTYQAYCSDVLDDTSFAFHGKSFSGAGPKRQHSSAKYLKKLGIQSHHI